jgi:EAL domain-containing protein (putative c-di-GMP-specific phosphodiesterase class I)
MVHARRSLNDISLSRSDLVEMPRSILSGHDIEPTFLDVEITEYMLFRDAMKDYRTADSSWIR